MLNFTVLNVMVDFKLIKTKTFGNDLTDNINTRISEVGVAFQHCTFFFSIKKKTFLEKKFEKNYFHLFDSSFFNIISEKKVKIIFFLFFFQKCFLKN